MRFKCNKMEFWIHSNGIHWSGPLKLLHVCYYGQNVDSGELWAFSPWHTLEPWACDQPCDWWLYHELCVSVKSCPTSSTWAVCAVTRWHSVSWTYTELHNFSALMLQPRCVLLLDNKLRCKHTSHCLHGQLPSKAAFYSKWNFINSHLIHQWCRRTIFGFSKNISGTIFCVWRTFEWSREPFVTVKKLLWKGC